MVNDAVFLYSAQSKSHIRPFTYVPIEQSLASARNSLTPSPGIALT